MLQPLFSLKPPEWKAPLALQPALRGFTHEDEDDAKEESGEE